MHSRLPPPLLKRRLFLGLVTACVLVHPGLATPPKKLPRDRPCYEAFQQIVDKVTWEKIGPGPTYRLFRLGAAFSDKIYGGDAETKQLAEALAQLPPETVEKGLAAFDTLSREAQIVVVFHARRLTADRPRLEKFLNNLPDVRQANLPTRPAPAAASTEATRNATEQIELLRLVEAWEASLP